MKSTVSNRARAGGPVPFVWVLLAIAAAVLLAATPAWASSPSGVSLQFYKYNPSCGCAQEASTAQAGEKVGYGVSFTATSALSGGSANDSITIFAPAGTVFPAGSEYSLSNNSTNVGYGVIGNVSLADGGSTVTIPLAGNDGIAIGAGDSVTVNIGLFGPSFVTNPDAPGQYTLDVSTSSDTTRATSASYTIAPETIAPKVASVKPAEDATGVRPKVNVRAFFSEAMDAATIDGNTIKLFRVGKGEDTPVDATVDYVESTKKARLNPSATLELGVTYRALVLGAEDKAGNPMDQDGDGSNGDQPKEWTFTVKSAR